MNIYVRTGPDRLSLKPTPPSAGGGIAAPQSRPVAPTLAEMLGRDAVARGFAPDFVSGVIAAEGGNVTAARARLGLACATAPGVSSVVGEGGNYGWDAIVARESAWRREAATRRTPAAGGAVPAGIIRSRAAVGDPSDPHGWDAIVARESAWRREATAGAPAEANRPRDAE